MLHRYGKYKELKRNICKVEGSLENFAKGNEKFGVRRSTDPNKPGIIATEWGASILHLPSPPVRTGNVPWRPIRCLEA